MRAWAARSPGPIAEAPLALVAREPPSPGPGEVAVEVAACVDDVDRALLDLAEDRVRGAAIIVR